MPPQLAHKMTESEYLAFTETADERYEWVGGEVYAMSGGRPLHAAVIMNVGTTLSIALRGSDCRATSSDQRIRIEETDTYVYPDVAVVCGPYEVSAQDPMSIVNPTLIVEVLSPTTADYDRGAKFEHYRRLPSLRDYLLVDPDHRAVTHLARTPEGWLRRDLTDGDLRLSHPDLTIPLAALFADLENVPTT